MLSCPNSRFQSEKIEPLWHGKEKVVPFIIVLKQLCFFGSPEHLKIFRYKVLSPQQRYAFGRRLLCTFATLNKALCK